MANLGSFQEKKPKGNELLYGDCSSKSQLRVQTDTGVWEAWQPGLGAGCAELQSRGRKARCK